MICYEQVCKYVYLAATGVQVCVPSCNVPLLHLALELPPSPDLLLVHCCCAVVNPHQMREYADPSCDALLLLNLAPELTLSPATCCWLQTRCASNAGPSCDTLLPELAPELTPPPDLLLVHCCCAVVILHQVREYADPSFDALLLNLAPRHLHCCRCTAAVLLLSTHIRCASMQTPAVMRCCDPCFRADPVS
jgi:hypothetical protein